MDDKFLNGNCHTMLEAVEKYKTGDYVHSYETAKKLIADGDVPDSYVESCAWIVYRYLRQMGNVVSLERMNACAKFFVCRLPKEASLVRSVFLAQVIEYSKKNTEFDFLAFCIAFDLTKLRDDDFKSNTVQIPSGQTICYESLAEKAATRIYNVMKMHVTACISSSLMPFFNIVKKKCPSNKYVDMYLALLYYWQGDFETAKKTFVKILRTAPQWYIWKNMAYITTDEEEQTAFLCKAASLVEDEKFKGKIHLQLATLLAGKDNPHAALELRLFFNTYQHNNWRICGDAYILRSKLQDTESAADGPEFYKAHAQKAEELVYGDIQPVELTFAHAATRNGKRRALMWCQKPKFSVELPLSRIGKNATPGDVYSARCSRIGGKPIVLTLFFVRHNATTIGQLHQPEKEIHGKVSLPHNGGGYAFIDRMYFVPQSLCSSHKLHEGQEIHAMVCQTQDGRWRAVKIL